METVTLYAEDFKTVHNTLCELRSVQERLTGVISSELADQLHRVIRGFEAGLKNAYEQDTTAFDRKWEHYHRVREEYGLQTTWSVYEVEDLFQQHAYPGAAYVIYDQHWGDGEVVRAIDGNTWVDLYRAADAAILASGDGHHTFIEQFDAVADKPHHLRLTTGS